MLLSVCLNPAVDVTYHLSGPLLPGRSHRVADVHERAGGKGVNVARVLHSLGGPVMLLAPVGGDTEAVIKADLHRARIDSRLIEIAGSSRRTVTVVDPADATVFNEPGPPLTQAEWAALLVGFRALLDQLHGETVKSLVLLSGSLPPGVPPDAYRLLTELATARGIDTVVDAEGIPLALALTARPYLVKPNLAELATITGSPLGSTAQILAAGHELRRLGARNVVISCGPDGLLAVTEDGDWQAVGPDVITGNPTGAGDALVAALAAGTVRGDPWPQRLREGVARSGAAVAAPMAGEFDPATWARLAPGVVVTRLKEPQPNETDPNATTPTEAEI